MCSKVECFSWVWCGCGVVWCGVVVSSDRYKPLMIELKVMEKILKEALGDFTLPSDYL